MFLERTEIDTNDHLFGRAHKSVEYCQSGKIGTPHISETARRAGGYLEKSSPSVSEAGEKNKNWTVPVAGINVPRFVKFKHEVA